MGEFKPVVTRMEVENKLSNDMCPDSREAR
jgi:hypothetical protein